MFHIKWNSLGRYYAISAHHRGSHIPFSILPIHPLNREFTFAKSFTIPATIHGATSRRLGLLLMAATHLGIHLYSTASTPALQKPQFDWKTF